MTDRKAWRQRSPLRVFESSIHGGLGVGHLGVVCSAAGVGKTAFLVYLALDQLLRGHHVLHIGLEQPVDRIRNYYDEIFEALARSEAFDDAAEARWLIERNRRIHTYQGHTFTVDGLETTLGFLTRHTDLKPSLMVLDGYDWDQGTDEDLEALKRIAAGHQAELWMSARTPRGRESNHPRGYPEPVARFERWIDVLVQLTTEDHTVHLTLMKDHGDIEPVTMDVDLDPSRLLLVRK